MHQVVPYLIIILVFWFQISANDENDKNVMGYNTTCQNCKENWFFHPNIQLHCTLKSNKYRVFFWFLSSGYNINQIHNKNNSTHHRIHTVVAKNIHDKSILKWQKCKHRNVSMKIILANKSMIDESSRMLKKEQSRHVSLKTPTVPLSSVSFSSLRQLSQC